MMRTSVAEQPRRCGLRWATEGVKMMGEAGVKRGAMGGD